MLQIDRPESDAFIGDGALDVAQARIMLLQIFNDCGIVFRQRRKASGEKMPRPLVGIIGLQEEWWLAAALAQQAIAPPGIAVHGTDGQGATVLSQLRACPV